MGSQPCSTPRHPPPHLARQRSERPGCAISKLIHRRVARRPSANRTRPQDPADGCGTELAVAWMVSAASSGRGLLEDAQCVVSGSLSTRQGHQGCVGTVTLYRRAEQHVGANASSCIWNLSRNIK